MAYPHCPFSFDFNCQNTLTELVFQCGLCNEITNLCFNCSRTLGKKYFCGKCSKKDIKTAMKHHEADIRKKYQLNPINKNNRSG